MKHLLPVLLILVVWGCGGDEPSRPAAPDPPVLTSLSLAPDSTLADSVAVAVTAERAAWTALFVDGSQAAADSLAPFLLGWDTRDAANGPHLLTVRAGNDGGTVDSTIACTVNNPGGGVVVSVSPTAATLASGDTTRFSATVLGAEDPTVVWSLDSEALPDRPSRAGGGSGRWFRPASRSGGGFASPAATGLGSVDSTGLYTAPGVPPAGVRILVTATSTVDPSAAASATVTVNQGPAVEITAAPGEVILGRTYQLEAAVYEMEDSTVTWSVVEGASHGGIDADGLYTAPDILPDPPRVTFHVAAAGDTALVDTTSAAMIAPILVTVSPGAPTVSESGYQIFEAELENAGSPGVIWLVEEGRRHGTIDQKGLFTAPENLPDPPRATVTAISLDDSRFRGSTTVSLVPGPPAGESALLASMFETGVHAANLTEQLVGIVGTGLDLARELAGDPSLTTGTLTELDDFWEYDAGPADALVIDPGVGPSWSIAFVSATGGMSAPAGEGYAGGMFYRGSINCMVTVGEDTFHLTNLSWTPVGTAEPGEGPWTTQFQRSVEGSVPDDDDGSREVSIQHNGLYEWSESEYDFSCTVKGTFRTPEGLSVTVDEILDVVHTCNCPGLTAYDEKRLRGTLTAEAGDDTYTWNNLAAATYYSRTEVIQESDWRGEGTLAKNDSPYGTVSLAIPLPWGIEENERPVLDYGFGHQVILLMPSMEDVPWMVPGPFSD